MLLIYAYLVTRSCPEKFFFCSNRCFPNDRKCDGNFDCIDGFDETNCSCQDSFSFRCKSGECIPPSLRCDSDPDCTDASDEIGCGKKNNFTFV